MAFDTIKKIKNLAAEKGYTVESVAKQSAENTANKVDSDLAEAVSKGKTSADSTTSSSSSSSSSSYNNYMKSALKMAKTQAWVAAGTSIFNSLANTATTIAPLIANSSGSAGIFSGSSAISGQKSKPVNYETEVDNKLGKLVEKYSDGKISDKERTKLQEEVSVADADRQNLAAEVVELDTAIKSNTAQKEQLTVEKANLEQTKNAQQKEVDNMVDALIKQYDAQLGELDTSDKAQDQIITDCNGAIDKAKSDCSAEIAKQDGIIAQNKTFANATPIQNQQTGQWSPCSPQQQQQAKSAIEGAENAKKQAEAARDKAIQEQEGIIADANKVKQDNEVKRQDLNAKKEKPQSEELTALKSKLSDTLESISKIESDITTLSDTINTDTQKRDKAQAEMRTISANLTTAQGLLSGEEKKA